MTTINKALDSVRAMVGKKVGNGQCYGLSAFYEHQISPDSTVGLGASYNQLSGAIGNTVNASDIGTAYRWAENGWTVIYPKTVSDIKLGGIINMKAHNSYFGTGQYGHTAIITAVNGNKVTLHEQNVNGIQAVVEQIYTLSQTFVDGLTTIVYPPTAKGTVASKTVNGDLYSGLITDADPNIMNSDNNRKPIDRIVIHHNAGTNDAGARRTWYKSTGVGTSAHYQITPDKIWGCISETSVAYHAGDYAMNQRSIGLEHLNNAGAPHWTIAEATYANSAKLIADICGRYGIPIDDQHIIPHKAVSATACPGGIDVARLIRMAKEIATGGTEKTAVAKSATATNDFKVQVIAGGLRIRQGAGLSHRAVGTAPRGVYTITATKDADNHTWGKLKSGVGWIALTYAKKI